MISDALRKQIRTEARNRCGYCLSLQKYVLGILEIDHIVPQAKRGTDDPNNLWLACRLCNGYKGVQTTALDPKTAKTTGFLIPETEMVATFSMEQ